MFKKVILGLIASATILSANTQSICFKLEGKMGEEIKALLEKYKGSLEPVSIQGGGNISNASADDIMAQVEAKIEAKKLKKAKEEKEKVEKKKFADGKKLYTSQCQTCHGAKANKEAYNTARALNSLSLEEIEVAIRGYTLDEYDRGMAMIMKPYAKSLSRGDALEAVYKYIQTLK